ncbi:CpcT/CpeT family chromophore lyase [Crocosphaera watsonii]|uniref:CpcT/CpeT family chromophore lyase n=1 Tax=Crocosphaera watsonii TaxID=263511 RepID=UPI0039C9413D
MTLIFGYFFVLYLGIFFEGIGFYSEQAYDYDLWSPYRQGVHRFVQKEGQVIVENYGLKEPILYAGAGRERDILKTITPDCIERGLDINTHEQVWGTTTDRLRFEKRQSFAQELPDVSTSA